MVTTSVSSPSPSLLYSGNEIFKSTYLDIPLQKRQNRPTVKGSLLQVSGWSLAQWVPPSSAVLRCAPIELLTVSARQSFYIQLRLPSDSERKGKQ